MPSHTTPSALLVGALLLVATPRSAPVPLGQDSPPETAKSPALVPIWTSGEGGYHTYRIPALVTTGQGTLLAFCEGRRAGRGDTGDIDMLLRRSTDGGETWSDSQIVWDDGENVCGNPCPVVDRTTGVVWLLMTHNRGTDHERAIIDGTSQGTRTVWSCRSEDDGLTWSKPTEITDTAKRANWTWYATGPGVGIQLERGDHAGRLVVPCDHIEADTKRYFSHVIVSDDHGATWRIGGRTPTDQVNECQVAELADGRLVLNMRNYDRTQRRRATSHSADGGETWSPLSRHADLEEPICQASLLRLSFGAEPGHDVLLFSNPADAEARVNMTVKISRDGGTTWPERRVMHAGPSAYSCLGVLADGRIACLFEGGDSHPYERILLARFPPEIR